MGDMGLISRALNRHATRETAAQARKNNPALAAVVKRWDSFKTSNNYSISAFIKDNGEEKGLLLMKYLIKVKYNKYSMSNPDQRKSFMQKYNVDAKTMNKFFAKDDKWKSIKLGMADDLEAHFQRGSGQPIKEFLEAKGYEIKYGQKDFAAYRDFVIDLARDKDCLPEGRNNPTPRTVRGFEDMGPIPTGMPQVQEKMMYFSRSLGITPKELKALYQDYKQAQSSSQSTDLATQIIESETRRFVALQEKDPGALYTG